MPKRNDDHVAELNLTYLEASFEVFRKSSFSLMILNAGAILALIGLLPIMTQTGLNVSSLATSMKIPLLLFVSGLTSSVCSQVTTYFSAHGAAWGKAGMERKWRQAGIICLIVSLVLFVFGACISVESLADPDLMRPTN